MKILEAAYYNENDPFCYYWLLNLIKKKLIHKGDVDGRSIEDVLPGDVTPYRQAHFFAGIGVWSFALKQAHYTRRQWRTPTERDPQLRDLYGPPNPDLLRWLMGLPQAWARCAPMVMP